MAIEALSTALLHDRSAKVRFAAAYALARSAMELRSPFSAENRLTARR
jgi:hypothetical protein